MMKFQYDKLGGFFGNVLKEISKAANFKTDLRPTENIAGTFNYEFERWSGVIGKVVEEKADVGIVPFGLSLTGNKIDVIDHSVPIILSTSYFYVQKSRTSRLLWSMYYKVSISIEF